LSTLAERIMVSYQNEAHLVHEFFLFGHFPLHKLFPDIFPCLNYFWFFPTPPITFLMVRPLKCYYEQKYEFLILSIFRNSYGKSDYFSYNFRIRLAAITRFKNDRDELGRVGPERAHNKTNAATFLCIWRGVRVRKIPFFDFELQYAWSALYCWRLRQRKRRWIGNFHFQFTDEWVRL